MCAFCDSECFVITLTTFHLRPVFRMEFPNSWQGRQNWIKSNGRNLCLAYDGMKIKGLIYNKYTDQLVGFVALDDVNDHILEFERACQSPDCTAQKPDLATHMLVLLVRGIFTQ